MLPQAPLRKPRNSSRINLLISFTFHAVIVAALAFFAAREGLLGHQLKKIAVEMVKEKPPEKPKEPEKPRPEELKPEPPVVVATPTPEPTRPVPAPVAPPSAATVAPPPAIAPPADTIPSFVFDGGKSVQTSSDPIQLYKGQVESALRARWNRPTDLADDNFVAEVEVSVDRTGRISDPAWKKGSGDTRWDASVREAVAKTPGLSRPPPPAFPSRILVRFDVQDATEPFPH